AWEEASGDGTIYSMSVMKRAETPYAIAYVQLAEGPSMLTNIFTDNLDSLKIGQKVKVKLVPTEGGPPLPVFTPA
ncbi:MAG: OB-fold domain-containing protein, partial [Rhodospirillales bacterium]|nr:OB-fold domain-containing protein [Rhodospirillales bacterium]